MILKNIDDAKSYLYYRLASSEKKLYGREKGIDRTRYFMHELGNPQEKLKTIHIAGTSGKGSVAYMLSSLLSENNSVGLHVSPHVYDIRERMQINNEYISEADFVNTLNGIIPTINSMVDSRYGRPTYFEVCLGLAYKLFEKNNIDYVVLETGIGGLYDSTNIIKRSDKLSIITKLGLDHTDLLGNTIKEIALQKAGIIPYDGSVLALKPDDISAADAIENTASKKCSRLKYCDLSKTYDIENTKEGVSFKYYSDLLAREVNVTMPLLGEYQVQNANIALCAFEKLAYRDNFEISEKGIINAFKRLRIPARTEFAIYNDKNILLDAAHNPQKIDAFFMNLQQLELNHDPIVIFGAKKGKDFTQELLTIKKYTNKLVISGFFNSQPDVIFKSTSPKEMAEYASEIGFDILGVFENPKNALDEAVLKANQDELIIVTGSMYMIGELAESIR